MVELVVHEGGCNRANHREAKALRDVLAGNVEVPVLRPCFWAYDRAVCRVIAAAMLAFPDLPRSVSGAIEDYYDHRRKLMAVIPPTPPDAA